MKTHKLYFLKYFRGGLLMLLQACLAWPLAAQVDYSDFVPSGERRHYTRPSLVERKVIWPAPLREADVKFSRRIIRCIDARQKMNKHIEWPRQPLNALLLTGLMEGAIVPYRNDSLTTFYNGEEFMSRITSESVIELADPDDADLRRDTVIKTVCEATTIRKFWIMEDWTFDYKLSVFKPHIVAIAPVFKPVFGTFEAREQPMCWISMDAIRQHLSNTEMFNRYNDAARLSYDDFFQMRIFDSYIIYESNVFDSFIGQMQEFENDPVGALLKSDEIKNDLFIFEHDLWQF